MAFEVIVFTFTLLLTIFPMMSASASSHPHPMKPSPFMSLKHLEGCRKGDNVQGVQVLKNYLQRFGYLNYVDSRSHRTDNDVFDDQLESALMTYQRFFNLEATGTLDAKTIAQMSKPRCGVPDISHEKYEHKHGHFRTISRYSFFRTKPKWRKYNLTYAFSNTVPMLAKTIIPRALTTWASSSKFRFTKATNYSSADLKISFEKGNHGDGVPFDGGPKPGKDNILAHAFAPQNGRLHFDADDTFVDGTNVTDAVDLETVALHELGHNLGLAHSKVSEAVMYPVIQPQTENRALNQDDIDGIKALYA